MGSEEEHIDKTKYTLAATHFFQCNRIPISNYYPRYIEKFISGNKADAMFLPFLPTAIIMVGRYRVACLTLNVNRICIT